VAQNQEIPSFQSTIELAQGDSSGMDIQEFEQARISLAALIKEKNPQFTEIQLEKFGIKQPDGSIKTANELLADSDGGPEALVQIAKGVDPIADKEESKGIFGFFGGD